MRFRENTIQGRTRYWRDDEIEKHDILFQELSEAENDILDEIYEEDAELWSQCLEFPDYWISTKGRLWSTISNKIIKAHPNSKNGYFQVKLIDSNGYKRHVYIHRLIIDAFVYNQNPDTKQLVRHLDDNRTNNAPWNLEWGDQKDNLRDAVNNGRIKTRKVIIENPKTHVKIYVGSCREAAEYLKVSRSAITLASQGKLPNLKGYLIKYE